MRGLSVGILILALGLASVEAGFGIGRCPNQPVVDNFVLGTYAGDWYEYGRYLTPGQAISGCTKITNTLNGPLLDVAVETVTLGITSAIKGQLKYADPSKTEAKLTISYFENAFSGREDDYTRPNYNVLDTDYSSYAIVYNCVDLLLFHLTDLYIYTRERTPPQAVIDDVYDELSDRGISKFLITNTAQRNCNN